MLFARHVVTTHCPSCGKKFWRASSSSLLFFLVLIVAGTVLTRAPFTRLVGSPALAIVLAVAANVALIAVLGSVTDRINRAIFRVPERCPTCDVRLPPGAYRYDGMLPGGQDLVILAGFGAAIWLLRALTL